MNRVWAFGANTAFGFGSLAIFWEIALGHNPETIVTRACLVMVISGLAGFFFRWSLARWIRARAEKPAEPAKPLVKKGQLPQAPAAPVKSGR